MPKSSFIDFKAVKSALTIERVLDHYGLLDKFKRSGDSLSGPCPIHKGSNPTQFRVSLSKNVWNCFSECKHGGNVLDFISRMENISIHAAAMKAIEWFHLDREAMSGGSGEDADDHGDARQEQRPPASKPAGQANGAKAIQREPEKAAPNKPLQFRLDKLDKEHPYLKERGLTPETIAEFGIGFCAKGMMAGRIAIPIHTIEGKVVAYAGRFVGDPAEDTPKYKLPQGFRKSQELYNIDRAVKEPKDLPLVIVEGFFDCMKLSQHGCRKTVALMGSSLSSAQEELIRKMTDSESRIIVMLDEDDAGRDGREDIAVRLSKFAFVKVHAFAKDGKQPDNLSAEEVAQITGGGR
jgi:DNA primase